MNGNRLLSTLSELQAVILALGLEHRLARRHLDGSPRSKWRGWLGSVDVTPDDLRRGYYNITEQGPAYRSASSAICKAFDRLAAKGLAERRYRGLWLKKAGLALAEKIVAGCDGEDED